MKPQHRPRCPRLHITVTATVHVRLGWLLAGLAVGAPGAPGLARRLAGLMLRAVGLA